MNYRPMLGVIAAIGIGTALVVAPAVSQPAQPSIIEPETLHWSPTPVPGVKGTTIVGNPRATGLYVVLAKYERGVKAPPHTHPDQRVVTVLSGTFYAGTGAEFDEANARPLRPGAIIVIPANAPHYGWAKDGEVIIQEVGVGPSGVQLLAQSPTK